MSACEGSCRMCPFTTMSSNKAPSESRPLAMWVILKISPTKITPQIFVTFPPTNIIHIQNHQSTTSTSLNPQCVLYK